MIRDCLHALVAVAAMLLAIAQIQVVEESQAAAEREAAEKIERAERAWDDLDAKARYMTSYDEITK